MACNQAPTARGLKLASGANPFGCSNLLVMVQRKQSGKQPQGDHDRSVQSGKVRINVNPIFSVAYIVTSNVSNTVCRDRHTHE